MNSFLSLQSDFVSAAKANFRTQRTEDVNLDNLRRILSK